MIESILGCAVFLIVTVCLKFIESNQHTSDLQEKQVQNIRTVQCTE